jgi:hypothetical protein
MDPMTGWFEQKQTKTKQSEKVANLVEQTWLSRYPWPPEYITFDNVVPSSNRNFGDIVLRKEYPNIKVKTIIQTESPSQCHPGKSAWNNVGNVIHTYQVENIDLDEDDLFAGFVSVVSFAVPSTYHTTLQSTQGQL